MLTYNGFYDNSLEWVGLEGIQLVASINPSGSLGRHQLSTRFTSIVRLCCMEYSSSDQLQVVYGTYLQPVVHASLSAHPVWRSTGRLHSLAGSMMRVFEQVCITCALSCCEVTLAFAGPEELLSRWPLPLSVHSSWSHSVGGGAITISPRHWGWHTS